MIDYLLFAPLVALVYLLALLPDLRRARERHARQDAIRREAGEVLEGLQVRRVHLLHPEHPGKSGDGWIGFDATRIRIIGELDDGVRVDEEFARDETSGTWLGRGEHGGNPLYWFSTGQAPVRLAADTPLGWGSLQATSDLYRQLFPDAPAPTRREKFHLQSQPASLVATVLFVALVLYASFDHLMERVALVGDHRWLTAIALALIPMALLLSPVFRRSRLPPREVLMLPLLLGFAAGLATIPLLKRIDRWSGDGVFSDTAYFHDGGCLFKPVQSGTPDLRIVNADEFCAQLHPGAEQSFYLRRGGLGLWQVDYDGLRRQIYAFHQGRDESMPRVGIR